NNRLALLFCPAFAGHISNRRISMAKTLEKQSLSVETAQRLIEAAEKKATQMKVPMCISICDESGNLKAFSRMDNAPLLSVQISHDTAYTAIGFGMATHEWWDFIKDDPPLLHGITHTPRLIVFGGGYPIKIKGKIVGGIGVSGGHWRQDMQVAEAALKE